MEYLGGFLLGLIVGGSLAKWWIMKELEYKAETGIDMCEGGKFYTVRRNHEREKNNERRKV